MIRPLAALILMTFSLVGAKAADCPSDKPFMRLVTEYFGSGTTTNNLNLVYCPPRLTCPTNADRCYYVAGCPIPPPIERHICLSQDDLDKAR